MLRRNELAGIVAGMIYNNAFSECPKDCNKLGREIVERILEIIQGKPNVG